MRFNYPMKLRPPLKDYIWGGTKLRDIYNKETDLDKVAESWELSCHADGESIIANGELAGQTLCSVVCESPSIIGSKWQVGEGFPIIVKLIDANDKLSIQLHPDDDYALAHHGDKGKNELWYIVDAVDEAEIVYGLRCTLARDELRDSIRRGDIEDKVNRVKVKKGDCFFVKSGMIHAIGKGIVIYEVQQSSNITYRVYDYNRLDKYGNKRELHLENAIAVAELEATPMAGERGVDLNLFVNAEMRLLSNTEYFTVYRLRLGDEDVSAEISLGTGSDTFHAITMINGSVVEITTPSTNISLQLGDTVFIPANLGEYKIKGHGEMILVHL